MLHDKIFKIVRLLSIQVERFLKFLDKLLWKLDTEDNKIAAREYPEV